MVERVAEALLQLLEPDALLIVLTGDDPREQSHVAHAFNCANASPDDPLIRVVMEGGARVVPADVDRSLASFGLSLEEAPGSWVGAPIVAAGKIIGAVSLSARTPSRYGERDLQIVQAVAGQAAIALVNARLLWMLSAGKRQ